jgi:hypothetical protein
VHAGVFARVRAPVLAPLCVRRVRTTLIVFAIAIANTTTQVLAAAVAVLRDLQVRAGAETSVSTAQLKQHFAAGREQAEAAAQHTRALDAKLDAVAREQAAALGRQLTSLREELEGHAAMQGEFTSQWLQQQASQLNAIGAAVERVLLQQQQQQQQQQLSSTATAATTAAASLSGNGAAALMVFSGGGGGGGGAGEDDLRVAFDEFSATVSARARARARVCVCVCVRA